MGNVSDLTNGSARGITKESFKPQTASDATVISGAIFDRSSLSLPLACEVVSNLAYTDGSGASGATHTVLVQILTSDNSNMSSPTTLKQKSVVITWAADGAKQFHVTVPADLSSAKRYVQANFTVTKGGTVTVTAQSAAQSVRFTGADVFPNSAYADAGYFESTDSAA